ncbi:phage tail sheath family protein [Hymenobacter ruricola]|uniref:Phage tail sheath family protein n=1 Tax=Hymenobacter ruricola TaxID=2791023 RepID=A0ABS0I7D1_9BACT|nr:phage tail sheath C-terminal domain-containing protein [Hymenobacter ruricola]MBF9222666.1 phage tail sheath family protein [Hymenobacter ruricola]
MAAPYTTPGVYIVEKNAFPNSVVQVETALPVFIGFTQKATYNGKDLTNIPTRVDSLKQFEDYFGTGFVQKFTLADYAANDNPMIEASKIGLLASPGKMYQLVPAENDKLYYLYNAIRLFYINGGSTCYILSIGNYATDLTKDLFINAIGTLVYEQDPTMLLCPDALRLDNDGDYNDVMTAMLAHCANVQSRIAMFDVREGAVTKVDDITDKVLAFRTGVGQNFLNYGVAYFPWVNTSVIADTDLSFYNLDAASLTLLRGLLNPLDADLKAGTTRPAGTEEMKVPELALEPDPLKAQNIFDVAALLLVDSNVPTPDPAPEGYSHAQAVVDKRRAIDNSLRTLYPDYKLIIKAMTTYLNTMPVSAAMAGVYTAVDSSRGVWKAPANWSLNAVVSPTVSLSDKDQGRLNIDPTTGKSINVIRAFKGMGVMVWGARTLDGNSQDWRYINVRRTMIMIEQSVKLAAHAYVFEPNDANTWVTVKSAINSFLFNLWKQGALAGSVPDDAYQVLIGLGSTMTADDILDGYMNVTVLVSIVRPAEFIELTFQQQMQKS